MLLDYRLKEAGISPDEIDGYDAEAATHMAVAAQVAGGDADCGMGVYSAAHAMGLDFIPIGNEEYDFVMRPETLELPEMQSFLRLLTCEEFKAELEKLGGYTTEHTGETREIIPE